MMTTAMRMTATNITENGKIRLSEPVSSVAKISEKSIKKQK